jgi:uncharacterized protein (UPF0371 family)
MASMYYRDDIYLCLDCYNFHDIKTDKVVHVPYSEMPADLALELMKRRNGVLYRHPPTKRKKGFGKNT